MCIQTVPYHICNAFPILTRSSTVSYFVPNRKRHVKPMLLFCSAATCHQFAMEKRTGRMQNNHKFTSQFSLSLYPRYIEQNKCFSSIEELHRTACRHLRAKTRSCGGPLHFMASSRLAHSPRTNRYIPLAHSTSKSKHFNHLTGAFRDDDWRCGM